MDKNVRAGIRALLTGDISQLPATDEEVANICVRFINEFEFSEKELSDLLLTLTLRLRELRIANDTLFPDYDVLKITYGRVTQYFNARLNRFVHQEFEADDEVIYTDLDDNEVEPIEEVYQPFNMVKPADDEWYSPMLAPENDEE